MKLFQWNYCLCLISMAFWLPASNIQAANMPRVDCTASMSTGTINFGNVTQANFNDANSTTATLNYNCTNRGIRSGYVSVCLAVDGGSSAPTVVYPRYMSNTTDNTRKLAFTMKLPNDILWGTRRGDGSEYNSGPIVMPRRPGSLGSQSSISGSVIINASLLSQNGNSFATAGTYIDNLNEGHTALTFKAEEDLGSADCATGDQDDNRFSFTVQANVIASCKINTTSDINLGSHPANETDILGNSNAINMTCTNDASYNIGLSPSNGDRNGAGVMSGTDGNPKVPYQLFSNLTRTTKWGNNGSTYGTLTNGFIGTGKGVSEVHTVYVTVPSADFKPDSYSDVVTINVNY